MATEIINQKYNQQEVSKAIDIVIDELLPQIPTQSQNLVPAEDLQSANAEINNLQAQVKALSSQASDLNNQINALQTQSQSDKNEKLAIQQENDIIANQLDSLSNVINQLTEQLSVALQTSINESVMRTSLHAANQGYKAQI